MSWTNSKQFKKNWKAWNPPKNYRKYSNEVKQALNDAAQNGDDFDEIAKLSFWDFWRVKIFEAYKRK